MSRRARRTGVARRRPGWVAALGWLLLLLTSLALVTWRQTHGLAIERQVGELEAGHARAEAERVALTRRIERLRSRARIVQIARDRLGMHLPTDDEIVYLPVDGPPPDDGAEEAP